MPSMPEIDKIKLNYDIIAMAKTMGFYGFGGNCFLAAVAINRVLFDRKGKLIGAFNEPLYSHRMIGHVAVLIDDLYWDGAGIPKQKDEISSWGMLDFEDPDNVEAAKIAGIDWTEEAALEYAFYEMTEAEAMAINNGNNINMMISMLEIAKSCITK